MLQRHRLRVLVAYSKTQYYVVNGVQHGTAYEYLKEFEKAVNRNYRSQQKNFRFHVFFVPVPRDQILSGLAAGKGDLAVAGLTVTRERSRSVDFSNPTMSGVKEIAVTGPHSPSLRTIDDLSGQQVFVRKSSSYWEHLERLNNKLRAEGKPEVILQAAPEDMEDEDLLEMLNAGLVSVVVMDDYVPAMWAKVYTNIRPQNEIVVHDDGNFAWAMRKNSPKLMAAVNEFIETHKRGTTFGNVVVGKYYSSANLIKDVATPAEIKKFQKTVSLFQQYSASYNVDYLLMMAEGYQESGLNHKVHSKSGAIGIMQLLPSTGQKMKVGDIHHLDANIHAGVKYIHFMVNEYFAKEPMTETNKLLFSFAAYNAGPGRIKALRREAAQEGLDPNVWSDNVEMIAEARIGRETVTYVDNIYKYYVAYKLIEEHDKQKGKTLVQMKPNS